MEYTRASQLLTFNSSPSLANAQSYLFKMDKLKEGWKKLLGSATNENGFPGAGRKLGAATTGNRLPTSTTAEPVVSVDFLYFEVSFLTLVC